MPEAVAAWATGDHLERMEQIERSHTVRGGLRIVGHGSEKCIPALERRIETLGTRIGAVRRRVSAESGWDKVVDSGHPIAFKKRRRALQEKLAQLSRGRFDVLQRVKEELAVMEDDLAEDDLAALLENPAPRISDERRHVF